MTDNISRNMYSITYKDRVVTYTRIGSAVSIYAVDYK